MKCKTTEKLAEILEKKLSEFYGITETDNIEFTIDYKYDLDIHTVEGTIIIFNQEKELLRWFEYKIKSMSAAVNRDTIIECEISELLDWNV